jgi:hypothetical protein
MVVVHVTVLVLELVVVHVTLETMLKTLYICVTLRDIWRVFPKRHMTRFVSYLWEACNLYLRAISISIPFPVDVSMENCQDFTT